VDPEEIATVIARQLEVAGSAAPAEQARATCDLDPAGAQMPGEPIVDARHRVRAMWVRQKAAAGGDRVTMRALAIKARGVVSGRAHNSVVATSDLACVIISTRELTPPSPPS